MLGIFRNMTRHRIRPCMICFLSEIGIFISHDGKSNEALTFSAETQILPLALKWCWFCWIFAPDFYHFVILFVTSLRDFSWNIGPFPSPALDGGLVRQKKDKTILLVGVGTQCIRCQKVSVLGVNTLWSTFPSAKPFYIFLQKQLQLQQLIVAENYKSI